MKSSKKTANIKNARLEKDLRSRLTAQNFSIICSNCIGGTIYNRLGLQFLSPTINMYFTQKDFIKFAVNLKHYIDLELQFIESDKPFPVEVLDDVTLYFNHSKSAKEAAEDWNRRKARIHYDNIYIIFYYRNYLSLEEIREIEKADRKKVIVLTGKPIDLEYAYYIEEEKGRPNSEFFLDKDKYGIRTFEKKWDFVSWLNDVETGTTTG